MKEFGERDLSQLYKPKVNSSKNDNGKVTIVGGSGLFHGAALLALKTASRVVDMTFFISPETSLDKVAAKMKSQLGAFIWVPWQDRGEYLRKSDAVLIGPGLMRYRTDKNHRCRYQRICDAIGEKTKELTHELLQEFPDKQWVIDAGSLQVMSSELIPKNAILTPNKKEFAMLFGDQRPAVAAKKHRCVIVDKGPITTVCSPDKSFLVRGGNAGLTKGGTGDILAGLAVALVAKNPPFLAACAASWLVKKTADELHRRVGFAYNADDLAAKIPEVLGQYFR